MSTLSLGTISAGLSDPQVVTGLFYTPATPDSCLQIINGGLDANNIPNFEITYRHMQRGQHAVSGNVAGTANLDYIHQLFDDYADDYDQPTNFFGWDEVGGHGGALTLRRDAALDASHAIPGGSKRFYLPFTSVVLLEWTVFFTNDCYKPHNSDTGVLQEEANFSTVFLTIDGDFEDSQRRLQPRTTWIDTLKGGSRDRYVHQGYRRSRWWHGHATVILAKGWHDATLRVVADVNIKQTRIWARSLKYIAFRQS